jgi:hypothetical protein
MEKTRFSAPMTEILNQISGLKDPNEVRCATANLLNLIGNNPDLESAAIQLALQKLESLQGVMYFKTTAQREADKSQKYHYNESKELDLLSTYTHINEQGDARITGHWAYVTPCFYTDFQVLADLGCELVETGEQAGDFRYVAGKMPKGSSTYKTRAQIVKQLHGLK